ncbi:MAG: hypothetical protein UZ01_02860 [Candidatus Brocadia sinica]|nr:MAG: hypothetical protein UZ01_02860 [Candidatus Brocadia sinica]
MWYFLIFINNLFEINSLTIMVKKVKSVFYIC